MADQPATHRASRRTSDTKIAVYSRAFVGLMLRDLRVLRREIVPFIIRVA